MRAPIPLGLSTLIRVALLAILVVATTQVANSQEAKPKEPVFDSASRLSWHDQHLKMREASDFKDLRWKHIGPLLMSGRVTDLAKPLDQPFTFYVATASGGLWKTTNEGTNWEPIFDDAPSASTGAVAVDPSNSQTVWVGLGESNIFRSSMSGTGVYRSDDEGKTWQSMGLAETHHIARIIVHPEDSSTVYVAACGKEYDTNEERGVYKTTDGGKTWNKVLYESEMAGAIDIAIDPSNPKILYASMWHRIRRAWSDPLPGDGGGIYKSTDGGENWERLTNGLPERSACGRIGISVSASQPETVYALIDSHEVTRKAREGERDSYGRQKKDVKQGAVVYRSDDRGETWNKVSKDSRTMERLFSTYGWVFGQIRVDPSNVDRVYVMGVPLLRSDDGGKNFEAIRARGLHGDHHAMWIDPSNSDYIINGNDGGVNISYDGGATWKDMDNLPVVQFYNVAYDWEEPFNVYGSIQDNNSWMGPYNHTPSRDSKNDWKRIPGGEASIIEIDPENADLLYSESFYGSIMRTDRYSNQTKQIKPKPADGEPPLRGQWLAPFQLSKHNSAVVYHGMNCVFRSMNRGDDWEQISPDLTRNDPEKQGNISYATITSLSESPLKFGVLYAGTDDGRLHVTRDSGQNWKEILNGLPKNKWVSRVIASAYDEGTVYVTQNGKRDCDFQVYVYRSRDYGETWEDISEGIPGGPVNVIKEDPKHPNILYVGTDLGVYVTVDNAKTWHVMGQDLPITFVHDLVIHPRDNIAVIATHGRGMFTLGVKTIQEAGSKLAKEIEAETSFNKEKQKFEDAMDAFRDAYQSVAPEERAQFVKDKLPKGADFAEGIMEIVKENPDAPIAFEALQWVASSARESEIGEKALSQLFARYSDKEDIVNICSTLAYSAPSPKTDERFKQLIAETPHDKVAGNAIIWYAMYLGNIKDYAKYMGADETELTKPQQEALAYAKSFEYDEDFVATLYEKAIDQYPDESALGSTVKEVAESALFELRNLSIGKVAPDIEGADLDGLEFKLSDYRGKVVLLDFWGDW